MKWILLVLVVKAFASVLSVEPNAIDLAWSSFEHRHYKDCLKYGRRAQRESPATASAAIVLGRCHERIGAFSEAHADFVSATKIEPDNADAWNNRVLMSIKDVRVDRAKSELKSFTTHIPDDKRIPDLRKMIHQLEVHLRSGEMTEAQTRKSIREIYLRKP